MNSCYKNKVKDYEIFYCKKEAVKNFKPIILDLQSKYCANNINAKFNISEDITKNKMEDRIYYKLGNFAKIYYYIFPHIWYESFRSNSIITLSLLSIFSFSFPCKNIN